MLIEIADGVTGKIVVVPATQVVVRQNNGTPIMVAAEYGEEKSQTIGTVENPSKFNRILKALGIEPVQVDTLELPKPPPGARLIAGPRD